MVFAWILGVLLFVGFGVLSGVCFICLSLVDVCRMLLYLGLVVWFSYWVLEPSDGFDLVFCRLDVFGFYCGYTAALMWVCLICLYLELVTCALIWLFLGRSVLYSWF